MKTEVEKILYSNKKQTSLGLFASLELAHSDHREFSEQRDWNELSSDSPFLHLIEYRDGEHYNDLYFVNPSQKPYN